MVVSATLRLSAGPILPVQRLDKPQVALNCLPLAIVAFHRNRRALTFRGLSLVPVRLLLLLVIHLLLLLQMLLVHLLSLLLVLLF
jgi:hypothetical protein